MNENKVQFSNGVLVSAQDFRPIAQAPLPSYTLHEETKAEPFQDVGLAERLPTPAPVSAEPAPAPVAVEPATEAPASDAVAKPAAKVAAKA